MRVRDNTNPHPGRFRVYGGGDMVEKSEYGWQH